MSLNSEIFVDKSELLDVTNRYVNTQQRFMCVSRPRRFGKSIEYSCAATPQIRQTGNRLSGLAETAYASLLAQCFV